MPIVYHVTRRADWVKAIEEGCYEAPSLALEGFIHCSQEHQVTAVLERYYSGRKDLVKLIIDTDKLSSQLVFEWSISSQDTFPHIYGSINISAVIDVINI